LGVVLNKDIAGNITVAFKYGPLFAEKAKTIPSRYNVHTFCCYLTIHLLEANCDVRTVQELMGRKDVSTTMIYTHLLGKPGLTIESPLDE
jgi:integrase